MSFWSRLKDTFRAPPPPSRAIPAAPPMPPEEAYLRQLLARLEPADGTPPPAPPAAGNAPALPALPPAAATGAPLVPPSFGGREFWSAVDHLIADGRARTAAELLRRFALYRPDDHALAARLVELLCDQLDHALAVPFLEPLTSVPEHALRASFLLGEAHERAGRADLARSFYEAVLAIDLDYPNARARADRLRPRTAPAPTGAAEVAPTLLGVEGTRADLGARYRLLREIGRGAAGAVYLAHDIELDGEVAVKLLHPHAASHKRAAARARSWNEARIAAALRHPGVVAVYDLDEEANLIAMEFCRGGTLRDRLQRGRLTPREALRRAAELCGTLAAVHRAGVVHLDLKPGNILFRLPASAAPALGDGDLVLADFGLAHLETEIEGKSDAAAGTLAYMAPERRRGAVSTAVDIYAVGVILYEMLAGEGPGDRAAILRGAAPPVGEGQLPAAVLTQLGPAEAEVRAALAALVAPDPTARPDAPTARARLDALRARLDAAN